jgi:hypothetical protein
MGSPTEILATRFKDAVKRRVGHAAVIGSKAKGGFGCFALVNEMLKSVGAKTAADFGEVTPDGNYVWGDEIPDAKDVKPGDVLQFRDHVITVKTTTTFAVPTRRGVTGEEKTETAVRPHHTAVVIEILDGGGVVVVEQHVKPNIHKVYRHTILRLAKGSETRMSKHAKIEVNVSGTVKAYRPVPSTE